MYSCCNCGLVMVIQRIRICRWRRDGGAGHDCATIPGHVEGVVEIEPVVLIKRMPDGGIRRLVVKNRNSHQPLRRVCHVGGLQFGRKLPLPFIPSVLEPNFYLGLGEVQTSRQAGSFRAGQIPFHVESRLQLKDLRSREHRSRLLLPLVCQIISRAHAGAGIRRLLLLVVIVVVALLFFDFLVHCYRFVRFSVRALRPV